MLPYQPACNIFFLSISHSALFIEYVHFIFMFQISKHLVQGALFESLNWFLVFCHNSSWLQWVKSDTRSLLPLIFPHHQTWLTFTSTVSTAASTYLLWCAILLSTAGISLLFNILFFTAYPICVRYFCWSPVRSWFCIFPIALCVKSKILRSFMFLLQIVLFNCCSECYMYIY